MAITNPFRDPDRRDKFDSIVKAWQMQHAMLFGPGGLPLRGNSVAEMFWRGYYDQKTGHEWDAASKQTLAYIWFRAGQAVRKQIG